MLAALLLALQAGAPPRDLAGVIAPILRASKIPALGAAIVTSEGLEAIGAVGVRSWTSSTKVTINDQWHIGSCTKAMTATLVARLIDRGVLSWETTIGTVFPSAHPAWREVPIHWLLSHRSGAPLNFDDELWTRTLTRAGSLREQRRFFAEEGLRLPPSTTPNTETIYSNAGFIVAGAMLEALTNTSWEDLMRHEVFEPLGHARGKSGWTPVPLGPNDDNPALAGPTGTIHITLSDWTRFVAAHLRGDQGDERYLRSATWQRLHSAGGADWGYSPGWVVTEAGWAGGKLLRHLGSNNFWVAEASLAPRRNFAVLIVTNLGDDAAEAPFKDLLTALVADHAAHAR